MITIRDAQMAALREVRIGEFVERMVEHLASEFPKQFERLARAGTKEFVERSLVSATGLGIGREGAIGALIELWFTYGEHFERTPDREWARNMLAHRRLPDYVKVEAIQDRLDRRSGGRVLVAYPAPTD